MKPSSWILASLFLLGQDDSSALASTKMPRGLAHSTTAYDDHNLEMVAADDIDQNRSLATDGKWETITYDGFEDGWGTFRTTVNSGGPNNAGAKLLDEADNVHTGHGALRLKCGGEAYQLKKYDVSRYSKLRLTVSMKGSKLREYFSHFDTKVRYQKKGSSKWQDLIKARTFDITEHVNYGSEGGVWIGGEYTYQTFTVEFDKKGSELKKVKLKFKHIDETKYFALGPKNPCKEKMYIDDVKFEGFNPRSKKGAVIIRNQDD